MTQDEQELQLYDEATRAEAPRLEMFARRKRDCWDVFCNEVEGSISLESL